ncbi:MAG: 3'-5' exonuclease [Candidatus Niyogibacteria bacterium]|nr:3'-5' exonuclease [Candidatus Niyogibacteria bacterium]
MMFAKDILIVDFEATAPDPYTAEPTQLGAVLLDKGTLAEKDSFLSYIYTDLGGETNPVSGISQDMLEGAPPQAEVGKRFFEKFGTDILLASWVEHLDRRMVKKLMDAAGLDYTKYDYHFLDIWPAAYIHLAKNGYTGGMRSEEMFQAFEMPPRGTHDALEDCRIAADILRKIVR